MEHKISEAKENCTCNIINKILFTNICLWNLKKKKENNTGFTAYTNNQRQSMKACFVGIETTVQM